MGKQCCGDDTACHDTEISEIEEMMASFSAILGTVEAIVEDENLSDAEKIEELKALLEELGNDEDEEDDEEMEDDEEETK